MRKPQRRKPIAARFWPKVAVKPGCWLWKGSVSANGYGCMWIEGRARTASRVAYELQVGPIPAGRWVLHHCDNPRCVRGDHLYLGTHADNVRDKVQRKRARGACGERNTKARLNADSVRAIRASRDSTRALMAAFGVSASTVQRIRKGKLWAHI